MINPILLAAASIMLAATSPVQAGTPDTAGGTNSGGSAGSGAAVAKSSTATKTKYCVVDTLTGSRVLQKVCLTRQQWLARGFDPTAPQ